MFKTREEIPPIFFNVINSPVLILFLSYNFLAFFCVVYVTYHCVIYRSLSTLKNSCITIVNYSLTVKKTNCESQVMITINSY